MSGPENDNPVHEPSVSVIPHSFAKIAGTAGVAGVLVCLGGLLVSGPETIARSYLSAYLFWLGLPLGCTSLLMLNHLAGGTWGLVIRRPLEAGAATLPLITVLFFPIALGLSAIYPWAGADVGRESLVTTGGGEANTEVERAEESEAKHGSESMEAHGGEDEGVWWSPRGHKERYFARPFFYGRVVGYFLIWNVLVGLLIHWSNRQDRTTDPGPSQKLGILGAPGLILLFLTGTFAMIDWVMSLDPTWYSTIFGAMMITGMGLETFAFIIFVTTLLADRGALEDLPTPARLRDLGNLLLAFVMLWAYVSYSQFFLIWSGNLAEEIPWYLKRTSGGWQVVGGFLIAFHFFLPFVALLFRVNKEKTRRLRIIAGAIFVIHLVDIFWLTMPSMGRAHPIPSLFDFAALVGVGGLWLALFTWFLGRRPLVPANDPDLIALRQEHNHAQGEGGS